MGARTWEYCWQWNGRSTDKNRIEHPFTGPEPPCGISIGVAKKAVRDWANRNHKKHSESITGFKRAKGLIQGPSARRTKHLFKLNRDQLRWVVELFTGHRFTLGLTEDPTCEKCLEKDESATHILCACEAVSYLRFCQQGKFFMEPSEYYDAFISKVLHSVHSVGVIKGKSKGEAQ
jgi:hypothetical protein